MLDRKPGAFAVARPLAQARERGEWTADFETMLGGLVVRHGEAKGTRHMVRILLLLREHARETVTTAVGLAVEYGAFGRQAVELLIGQLERDPAATAPLDELGRLAVYERPKLGTKAYDQLIGVLMVAISPLALLAEVLS